ncbi:IS200/IS605 family element transposase accessory protein TnpB [Lonepinella koalarum]|uniref:Putative transposase n=2 Tax=Lonepinella koalarum TaxID=53417 RepID=A0A4R1KIW2_9PAST|nr:RNA-guided endonuclease TnpB family protein [Lonepinella koalarum]MDH2925585.1 transposase [Lonepinella koalarum]MDH2925598.1 transposase [Lonepinella koalarum]MDH2926316.1 transposase [Lonepinella koalarum]MDH2926949.1 transposase [Lonepinella koalarum]MDH2927281.1 transposase [Lonepinella koalarum]
MLIRKAFKFEIRPNGEQTRKIKQFCGCSRFVFNQALAWQNEQYEQDNQFKFSYTKIANLLPSWKKQWEWLKDCHSQVLQQSLKDLEVAFKNFFQKRADFPKFKKKGLKDSFRFPQGCKLEQGNNRLYLPKIGWVRYFNSRKVIGEIKNVTVSQKCGHFFVSIQTEFEAEIPTHKGGEIGIDMGIARFATLSNGVFFAPLNAFKTYKGKLAKLQKQLKNKVKFSQNWQKLKAKIAKLHHKIANCRKNFLHQTSNQISKNHAMIYVEDLQVANMSKSAKGTVEEPGKNVSQKSGLNRSILDQSWFEFRRQLDYKTQWRGGFLVAVTPQNTSRTCPCCGLVAKENRETQSHFECIECGYSENADVVGAINILTKGRLQLETVF